MYNLLMGQIVSYYMEKKYPTIQVEKCKPNKCDMCKTNTIFNNVLKSTSDEIDLYYESYANKTLTEIFGEQLFSHDYKKIAYDVFYLNYNNLPEINKKNYGIFSDLNTDQLKLSNQPPSNVINDFNMITNRQVKFAIFMADIYNAILLPRLQSKENLKMGDIFTYEITYTNDNNYYNYYYILTTMIIILMIFLIFMY